MLPCIEYRFTIVHICYAFTGTKVDTGTVIRTCTVLLSHREEITREATITLISTLLTVDIIQNLSTGGLGALLALSRKLSDLQRKASTGVDKGETPCLVLFMLGVAGMNAMGALEYRLPLFVPYSTL